MKYYLGIDGGGTKTTAVITDESGINILTETGKTINFYSIGIEAARNNLKELIDNISLSLGKVTFCSAFIGCSALDSEADESTVKALCGGIINAEKIKMNSDVYIALKSLGDTPCPAVAICGTGSMAIGENEKGNLITAGGWGHILGDEGSAYSIAISALNKCCYYYDMGKSDYTLVRFAENYFGVSDFKKIIGIIYTEKASKDYIAGFAHVVSRLADEGNIDCRTILQREVFAFAKSVILLLDKLKNCTVLGLYGGVFQNNLSFRDFFTKKIKEEYPEITIEILKIPPAEAAARLARELK